MRPLCRRSKQALGSGPAGLADLLLKKKKNENSSAVWPGRRDYLHLKEIDKKRLAGVVRRTLSLPKAVRPPRQLKSATNSSNGSYFHLQPGYENQTASPASPFTGSLCTKPPWCLSQHGGVASLIRMDIYSSTSTEGLGPDLESAPQMGHLVGPGSREANHHKFQLLERTPVKNLEHLLWPSPGPYPTQGSAQHQFSLGSNTPSYSPK